MTRTLAGALLLLVAGLLAAAPALGAQPSATFTSTSLVVTLTVDTTPPETTIDSGPSGLTNEASPSFAFASDDPGASFRCRLDGGTFLPCGSPLQLGPLADGPHTFRVRAIDQAGNRDASPAVASFTVVSEEVPCSNEGNTVTDYGSAKSICVKGVGNTVSVEGENDNVVVIGNANTLDLVGDNLTVIVEGDDNAAELDQARGGSVSISGTENRIWIIPPDFVVHNEVSVSGTRSSAVIEGLSNVNFLSVEGTESHAIIEYGNHGGGNHLEVHGNRSSVGADFYGNTAIVVGDESEAGGFSDCCIFSASGNVAEVHGNHSAAYATDLESTARVTGEKSTAQAHSSGTAITNGDESSAEAGGGATVIVNANRACGKKLGGGEPEEPLEVSVDEEEVGC